MTLLQPGAGTTDTIATHLLTLLEPDYIRGWFRVRQVGFSQLSEVRLFRSSSLEEKPEHLHTPEPLMELADLLKEELHEAERGSWLTLDFLIAINGEYELAADYTSDPTVGVPEASFTEEDFQAELAAYPRRGDCYPEWLLAYA